MDRAMALALERGAGQVAANGRQRLQSLRAKIRQAEAIVEEQGQREWVMLVPAGRLDARDGRRWRLTDAGGVVAATRARAGSTDLAIDFEHQTKYSRENGQPAPAAGWITELQARAGAVWGRIRWTDRAASMLRARECRYLSPAFMHRPDGVVTCLSGAALTNSPALDLPGLA